jgi:4-diphosphocytidyl-2-C-methyl-D-erythritol kinase
MCVFWKEWDCPDREARSKRKATTLGARARARPSLSPPTTTRPLLPTHQINLFLRVTARRPDGYHDLASLFHIIDLGDAMAFEVLPPGADDDELLCDADGVPTDGTNLAVKALHLFRAKTGVTAKFRVTLDKRVPHGAGLGGGSGNAATALWAANELTGRPASPQELSAWAGEIGSDISVFFSRGAAYCTGRGEVVEDVAPPLPLGTPLLLVKPPAGLATPAVFKALDLETRSTADPLALMSGLAAAGRASPDLCVNDLEPPAFSLMPDLAAVRERLGGEPGFDAVFMTGSGSTVVGVGSHAAPAWLAEPEYEGWFVGRARLVAREEGAWYDAPVEA